jgi:hypothetical protein
MLGAAIVLEQRYPRLPAPGVPTWGDPCLECAVLEVANESGAEIECSVACTGRPNETFRVDAAGTETFMVGAVRCGDHIQASARTLGETSLSTSAPVIAPNQFRMLNDAVASPNRLRVRTEGSVLIIELRRD